MSRIALLSSIAAVSLAFVGQAFAAYPEKVITYIVPWTAGSGTDIATRAWMPYMEKCIGGTIIVENLPGAGGSLGFARIATAKPDGYTLGNVTVPNMIVAGFTSKVPWKEDSFEFLGTVTANSSTLSVRKDSPLNTVDDFIKTAKASATPINIGVGGIGGDDQIAAVQITSATGVKANIIPFGENALTRAALLGGHVDIVFLSNAETTHFRDGIKPLAVASAQRSQLLADVPTFKELGFDFVAGATPVISAPKGTPAAILDKWKACQAELIKNPEVLAELTKRELPVKTMNAEEVTAWIDAQRKSLTELWKASPWIK